MSIEFLPPVRDDTTIFFKLVTPEIRKGTRFSQNDLELTETSVITKYNQ